MPSKPNIIPTGNIIHKPAYNQNDIFFLEDLKLYCFLFKMCIKKKSPPYRRGCILLVIQITYACLGLGALGALLGLAGVALTSTGAISCSGSTSAIVTGLTGTSFATMVGSAAATLTLDG